MFSIIPETINRKIEWKYRLITAPFRALPDFLIIGAMKSGTSSLFHYLAQHPQLIPARKKEVHYFDSRRLGRKEKFLKDLNWYRSHFPLRKMMPAGTKTYEATPRYICHPVAAKHIRAFSADVKMIVMLRNPTERAIAHYFHTKKNRPDPESLHAAMGEEVSQLSLGQGPILKSFDIPKYDSYLGRGLYHMQIQNYLSCFDKEQLLIINSEEFFNNTAAILFGVFQFLGVRTDITIKDLTPRNVSNRPKDGYLKTKTILDEFFRPHNEELFEFLGKRYNW